MKLTRMRRVVVASVVLATGAFDLPTEASGYTSGWSATATGNGDPPVYDYTTDQCPGAGADDYPDLNMTAFRFWNAQLGVNRVQLNFPGPGVQNRRLVGPDLNSIKREWQLTGSEGVGRRPTAGSVARSSSRLRAPTSPIRPASPIGSGSARPTTTRPPARHTCSRTTSSAARTRACRPAARPTTTTGGWPAAGMRPSRCSSRTARLATPRTRWAGRTRTPASISIHPIRPDTWWRRARIRTGPTGAASVTTSRRTRSRSATTTT